MKTNNNEMVQKSSVDFRLSRKAKDAKLGWDIKITDETPKKEYAEAEYANLWCYDGPNTDEAKQALIEAQATIEMLGFTTKLAIQKLNHRELAFKQITNQTVKYSASKTIYLTIAEKFALLTAK